MSWLQRVTEVLMGLLTLACAAVMLAFPDIGYALVIVILSASLQLAGLGRLVYYLTMARHMVDGKVSLYAGVLLFDAGVVTGTLTALPPATIMLYLLAGHVFAGAVDVMRALDERRLGSSSWRWTVAIGATNLLVGVGCLLMLGSQEMMVDLYAAGLVYSAIVRIVTAFRRTAIVYIA